MTSVQNLLQIKFAQSSLRLAGQRRRADDVGEEKGHILGPPRQTDIPQAVLVQSSNCATQRTGAREIDASSRDEFGS